MPRRNRCAREPVLPARARRARAVYHRDTCGKLLFPTFRIAERFSGRAQAEYGPDNGDHWIYHCRWNPGWHLSSVDRSTVDARRAYHQREEVNPCSVTTSPPICAPC
jgi:hypothetical protein